MLAEKTGLVTTHFDGYNILRKTRRTSTVQYFYPFEQFGQFGLLVPPT
jgi:hypothetical protein